MLPPAHSLPPIHPLKMSLPIPSTFEPRRGRGRGGPILRPRGGRGGATPSFHSNAVDDLDNDEADEVRELRDKYGSKLGQAKELFPEWSDDDILFALQDATGDVEVAILRISEGAFLVQGVLRGQQRDKALTALIYPRPLLHPLPSLQSRLPPGITQQWAAAKPKKIKKETPAYSVPVAATPSFGRGGFGDRGRGRGAFGTFLQLLLSSLAYPLLQVDASRGARGGRGVARGGRGGIAPAAPRAPYTNDDSNGSTPASFVTPPAWGAEPVASTSTAAPSAWGDLAASTSVATPASEWGAATEASTTATVDWGDESPPAANGAAASERPETPAATAPAARGDGWGAVAPVKAKPVSKTIAPGSKMSWAQVTK